DARRCQAAGVTASLTKPVRQSVLREALLSTLAHAHQPIVAETRPPDEERHESTRILVAEDNPVNRRLVTAILERQHYAVVTVENGRGAVDALRAGAFALVLMDMQMREMDGLQATAQIRQDERQTGRHLPIVALTAHAMKGDAEMCLAAGVDA